MAANQPIPYTREMMLELAAALEAEAGTVRGVVETMDRHKLTVLDVPNAKEVKNGLHKLTAFAQAAKKVARDAVFGRPTR